MFRLVDRDVVSDFELVEECTRTRFRAPSGRSTRQLGAPSGKLDYGWVKSRTESHDHDHRIE